MAFFLPFLVRLKRTLVFIHKEQPKLVLSPQEVHLRVIPELDV